MKIRMVIILVILFFALVGCQFGNAVESNVTPEALLYTQAAQTVMVQLTQNAINDEQSSPLIPAITVTSETLPTITPSITLQPAEEIITPVPTATSAPTETETPIPPSITPTSSEDDITKSLGGATWIESFNDSNNWSFSSDDRISMEVLDGKAILTAKNPDYYYGWSVSWRKSTDFYLEITVKTGNECSGLDKYGLIFRSPKPSEGYLLGFSCDGKYRLWYFNGSSEVLITDWVKSDKINIGPDQTNRVGIKAVGYQFSIFANGTEIGQISDSTQIDGNFGLMIGSVKTENFTVSIDSLSFWDLK